MKSTGNVPSLYFGQGEFMGEYAVWTVNDYWDGCVIGVAEFDNRHCIYERIFDEKTDDWSDNYYLTPINKSDFAIIMHDWERWKRWRSDFDKGSNTISSHEKGIDIGAIARNAPNYRKFTQHGVFTGDWRYCENVKVIWSDTAI